MSTDTGSYRDNRDRRISITVTHREYELLREMADKELGYPATIAYRAVHLYLAGKLAAKQAETRRY